MIRFIFIAVIIPFTQSAMCQQDTRYFDIKFGGIKIGELKATRTIRDTLTLYTLESDVSFWCITPVKIRHQIETVYLKKQLLSSRSVSNTSHNIYTSSIIWRDGHYQIKVDSYKYTNDEPIHELVECNIARLYFVEPVNIKKTLADSEGILSPIIALEAATYEVGGHGKNIFYYDNGVLVRASILNRIRYEVVARKK
jgi:hypothetical protein